MTLETPNDVAWMHWLSNVEYLAGGNVNEALARELYATGIEPEEAFDLLVSNVDSARIG